MTRFDPAAPGPPESLWRDVLDHLPTTRLVVPSSTPVLVLAAHPDDESLGAGGLIAAAARRGCTVRVLLATDGEASHPGSPTRSRAELAEWRRRETRQAVSALAPGAEVEFLALPDGRLDQHGEALDAALRRTGVTGGWLVAPWAGDGHPDHEACGRAARRYAEPRPDVQLLEYPVWAWHWGSPADPGGQGPVWEPGGPAPARLRRLDLDADEQAAKAAALACHRSQTEPLSTQPGDEAILPPHVLARFRRPFELFVAPAPAARSAYFDRLYARQADPWQLATRFYEQRKRALQLACLPRPRFRRAFEPGCALGLLTEELAARCDELVATDAAKAAVRQTRVRVGEADHVRIGQGRIPDQWPDGTFDLIVISEVGYYCPDLDALRRRIGTSLTEDGVLIACHWRHPAPDHPHGAGPVHEALGTDLLPLVRHVEQDFLLDVWSRSGVSVATSEGVLD